MNKNIICFGEVLWDKYPEKTELGGAPFNVFSRLHSFGNNVKLISAVGDDKLGLDILKYFKKKASLSRGFFYSLMVLPLLFLK